MGGRGLPLHDYGLEAARAQIAEARGDLEDAAAGYAEIAARREDFGAVLEQAYALLGQGRCLVALGEAAARRPVRTLFEEVGARPRAAECDTLLARALAAGA